jgi:hypothetical protein
MRIDSHRLGTITVDDAEFDVLWRAACSGDAMIAGDSTRNLVAKRARILAGMGLLRFMAGAEAGWPAGMWAAYPTCNGMNALWRHAGDAHVDGCGSVWNADGTCSGCRACRRLDLPTYQTYLAALVPSDRDKELGHSALWCVEHGYMRLVDVTTRKVCRFAGTSIHDGGLDRIGRAELIEPSACAIPGPSS